MAGVYGLNLKSPYGYDISVELLDERLDKQGSAKPEFRTATPLSEDGRIDFGAIKRVHPAAIKWKDSAGRRMPDFHGAHGLNVSAEAKAIIEQFEPGLHTFVPFECVYSRGGRIETRYWLTSGQKIDAVDPVASNMVMGLGSYRPARDYGRPGQAEKMARRGIEMPTWADVTAPTRITFKADRVAGAHLFSVEGFSSASHFISADLREAFGAAGLIGLQEDAAPIALS